MPETEKLLVNSPLITASTEDDFEWVKEEIEKIYKSSTDISMERWDRVRWEIDFYDLAISLLEEGKILRNHHGGKISCPFHGTDSTPSFNFYQGSNSAFCFGCEPPATNQFYDNVRFVSALYGISRRDALKWLEKKYKLPALQEEVEIPDSETEEEEGEIVSLTFDDLKEPFLVYASVLVKDADKATAMLEAFFKAQQNDDPLPIAKFLGKDRISRILRQKVNSERR